ncbi:uncharacterized protein LOC131380755 [Hylobates moloch]|uniref:uncharacterized protein LOC131380755 n=1 Tax=Hylobates moloch TaxID=81572 RepID=UPI002676A55F|nr:uncharacterized protein LOC131380755 [Hylobates moloch]
MPVNGKKPRSPPSLLIPSTLPMRTLNTGCTTGNLTTYTVTKVTAWPRNARGRCGDCRLRGDCVDTSRIRPCSAGRGESEGLERKKNKWDITQDRLQEQTSNPKRTHRPSERSGLVLQDPRDTPNTMRFRVLPRMSHCAWPNELFMMTIRTQDKEIQSVAKC